MIKLFFKKSLILKIIAILFFLIIIFSFLGILNNQKNVFADDQQTSGELDCGKEIPLGEAIEKTNELLGEIVQELDSIRENIYYQTTAAEEMINLAKQCDLSTANCSPGQCEVSENSYECEPCLDGYFDPVWVCTEWSVCHNQVCQNPGPCQGEVCPEQEIQTEFNKTESAYNSVQSSKNKIFNLIDGNNEFLCDKLNEDIRGATKCSQACLLNPGAEGCPKINAREAIRRKLYLSRNEFDKCYVPPVDWAKILRGELSGKMLFPCPSVVQEEGGLSYYTKTTEEKDGKEVFLCTNNHNWFCCFSYGLESISSSCSWSSGNSCPEGLLENDYSYCGNRPIRLMTCCCPDFDMDLEPGSNSDPDSSSSPNPSIENTFNGNSDWINHTVNEVRKSQLMNASVSDASSFFLGGNITENNWVRLLSEMARHESNYNPNLTYQESFKNSKGEYVISTGLFQLSYESVAGYGFPGLTTNDLKQPILNITIAVKILERWVVNDGCIACQARGAWQGGARYWSVLRPPKVNEIKKSLK
jgi:hypothetical protein